MLKSIISGLLILSCSLLSAQTKTIDLTAKDTVVKMEKYGLRVGIDLSKPLLKLKNQNYSGLEIVGDFRLNQWWYLAAEMGTEKKTIFEDTYNYTSSGSFIKLGGDYNNYENWYGMNSIISIGPRVAFSTYNLSVTNFSFYNTNRYWFPNGYDATDLNLDQVKGLSSVWLEIVLGIKTELFSNLYLGGSVRVGYLLSHQYDLNYPNNWVPGFNNLTEDAKFGTSYNYSITYLIALFEKPKKYKKAKEFFPTDGMEENELNNTYSRSNRSF